MLDSWAAGALVRKSMPCDYCWPVVRLVWRNGSDLRQTSEIWESTVLLTAVCGRRRWLWCTGSSRAP